MKFTTVLEGGNTLGIPVPAAVLEALGAGKRPKVVVSVGQHSYRSSIMPYKGKYMISLSADNRAKAGVEGGQEVEVEVELDTAPRVVEVPADLAAALAAGGAAKAAFEKLSYSNQSRIVLSVENAKTVATRQRRIAKAVEELAG